MSAATSLLAISQLLQLALELNVSMQAFANMINAATEENPEDEAAAIEDVKERLKQVAHQKLKDVQERLDSV